MLTPFDKPINQSITNHNTRLPINQLSHGIKGTNGTFQFPNSTISINSKTKNGFRSRAREDTVGARAGVGSKEVEERGELGEAVGDGESAGHPLEGGVVVAEGVDGGGPGEDVEVVVGEVWVVVELGFQEVEESFGSEGWLEVGLEEGEETEMGVVSGFVVVWG